MMSEYTQYNEQAGARGRLRGPCRGRGNSLAATLRKSLPRAEIELVDSGGGRFEVVADGRLLFSKAAAGRHPTHDEVLEAIDAG